MTYVKKRLAPVLAAGFAAILTSCTQAPQQPASQPTSASPATQAAAAQGTPWPQSGGAPAVAPAPSGLGSSQFKENPAVRCDLLEVKRVSGNALMVRWRVVNTADQQITYDFSWEDIYFIDPTENKRYSYLTDSEGKRILDTKWGAIKPGEQWLSWAKFPAPPATSSKISLSIAGFAPFEDVPVTP